MRRLVIMEQRSSSCIIIGVCNHFSISDIVPVSLCHCRVEYTCLLCWTTLPQGRPFCLECLLKLSVLRGFTVRETERWNDRRKKKKIFPVVVASNADVKLVLWWEICLYGHAVTQRDRVLLGLSVKKRKCQHTIMVFAPSVSGRLNVPPAWDIICLLNGDHHVVLMWRPL